MCVKGEKVRVMRERGRERERDGCVGMWRGGKGGGEGGGDFVMFRDWDRMMVELGGGRFLD